MSEEMTRRRSKTTTNNKNKKNKPKQKKGNLAWRIWCVLFSLIFIGTAAVGGIALSIYFDVRKDIPQYDVEQILTPTPSVVIDRNGNRVSTLAEDSLIPVTREQIPEFVFDSITSIEDARFYIHKGIDGPRTMQAFLSLLTSGGITSGGSTVTQQLVQNTVLKQKMIANVDGYTNSKKRKIEEWIIAYQLEKQLTKDEIMVSYLNNAVSFGQWVGIGTASKRFFNKSVSELTMPEAALLAGIPQLPGTNNPYVDIDSATKRYEEGLYLLNRHGHITKEEEEAMAKIPLADLLIRNQDEVLNPNGAYFSVITAELEKIFNELYGEQEIPNGQLASFFHNLTIYTNFDAEKQNKANEIMNTDEYVDWDTATRNVYGWNTELTPHDQKNFQGAFAAIENTTGAIAAVGASRNYNSYGQNIAIEGYRSPGSSIKPIIDYAPYVEKFQVGAGHIMNDSETTYSGGDPVSNYNGGGYSGFITMEKAIADSKNTTAVRAMQAVGLEYAAEMAGNMGLTKAKPLLEAGLLGESSALGGGLEATAVEMAGAYSTFANAGVHNKPHAINKIVKTVNGEEQVIWEYTPERDSMQVMSEATAATMVQTLIYTEGAGTPNGGGRRHIAGDVQVGAKTGTSSYSGEEISSYGVPRSAEKDHWHVSITPDYSIAAWTGLAVENEDVLTRTGGNVNTNKHWGSLMIKGWMDAFSPEGTRFSFLGSQYASNSSGSIENFSISANIDENGNGSFNWTKPGVNVPTGLTDADRKSIGDVIYEVSISGPNGGVHANVGDYIGTFTASASGTYTVTITAKVSNERAQTLLPPVTLSSSPVSYINPNDDDDDDETTDNNETTENNFIG